MRDSSRMLADRTNHQKTSEEVGVPGVSRLGPGYSQPIHPPSAPSISDTDFTDSHGFTPGAGSVLIRAIRVYEPAH